MRATRQTASKPLATSTWELCDNKEAASNPTQASRVTRVILSPYTSRAAALAIATPANTSGIRNDAKNATGVISDRPMTMPAYTRQPNPIVACRVNAMVSNTAAACTAILIHITPSTLPNSSIAP